VKLFSFQGELSAVWMCTGLHVKCLWLLSDCNEMALSVGDPFVPRTTGDILTLWMDLENQKHGRALRRRTTCQVPRNVTLFTAATSFVVNTLIDTLWSLLSHLTPNYCSSAVAGWSVLSTTQTFEYPLHFYTVTVQDDTSNTLPCSDWSDNERVLLLFGWQI
jgi:hypothetical protein